jgi:hypothetical protein
LSGFKKGGAGPTDQQIADSLQLAMKMFWNFESMNGSAVGSLEANPPFPSRTASVSTVSQPNEPKTMACESENISSNSDEDLNEFMEGAIAEMSVLTRPIRMYKGDTTDEGNFIGHGISDGDFASDAPIYALGSSYPILGNPDAFVALSSLWHSFSGSGNEDIDVITVSGITFVSYAFGYTTRDASAPSASSGDSTAEITSLDFYTY